MDGSKIDLSSIRRKLEGARGKEYWRSLEEVAETPEFLEYLHREFPAKASEWLEDFSRRDFLKLMGASLALAGLTSCTRQPLEKIVPYVRQPEMLVPGKPLEFATAMPFNGFGYGILVESHEGRPTKVEGNPDHPMSLGATNIFGQACLLDLYDPDRAQSLLHTGKPSSWGRFLGALQESLAEQRGKGGAGLRVLTESVASPTLAAQLGALLSEYPEAAWHQYEPISIHQLREGAREVTGRALDAWYAFDKAKTILCLDSDFLFAHPASLRFARDFSNRRRVRKDHAEMNRLYVAEAGLTLTGSMADHRIPLAAREVELFARAVASRIGMEVLYPDDPAIGAHSKWIEVAAQDLVDSRGESLLILGEHHHPRVHALVFAINQHLGNFGKTIDFIPPAHARVENPILSIDKLATAMRTGEVELLLVLGGNPVFNAPADVGFAEAMGRVNQSICLSLEENETSRLCDWLIPQAHFLESWGDLRSFDGTSTILQPLIAPLYGGKSVYELMRAVLGLPTDSSYEVVRAFWESQSLWEDFDRGWERSVHDGFVEGSTSKPVSLPEFQWTASPEPTKRPELEASVKPSQSDLELIFRPDPSIWDGRFANNPWLQELPKHITKITWDNVITVSPRLAEELDLNNRDVVELQFRGRSVRGPVWILPGHPEFSVTVHLGYGRTVGGRIASTAGDGQKPTKAVTPELIGSGPQYGGGYNAYMLRVSEAPWFGTGLTVLKTGEHYPLAATQHHHSLEGRHMFRHGTLEEFRRNPEFAQEKSHAPKREETLYYPEQFEGGDYAWGMAIDLNTCIGCSACVMACFAENNIPLVGKRQVSIGREMHWLRVDSYYRGEMENPVVHHQPVPCMHCENAPCEYVCPVGATLHDYEGLNLQVYNRCIGTRYCSNNCPYKVRRFNFLQYSNDETEVLKLARNPDVTVRSRGVMEKCTYCLQRISAARIEAQKENRPIRDGEVRTACQQVCPTQAIMFGNMKDQTTQVSKWKAEPTGYDMLAELGTRPRTSYLAKLTNPHPDLG